MILLPVEKQFDWGNPPLVIILLVFLNIFCHVFSQASDQTISNAALTDYMQKGFYAEESHRYEDYLLTKEGPGAVADLAALERAFGQHAVAHQILHDKPFEAWLAEHWDWELASQLGGDWRHQRNTIVQALAQVSSLRFGLIPADLNPVSFLTHQFLHADFMHLFGNMFFLVLCGFTVETAIGHFRFLAFYLIAGGLAGLGQTLLDLDSTTPLVGASGAISGVMAMYLALFRLRRIEFFYWIFVFVGYLRLPALAVLPLYVGKELWFMLAEPNTNIAFMAHATGFVAGALLIGAVLLLRPQAVKEEYIEQDQREDPQRNALAAVYDHIGAYHFSAARRKLAAMRAGFGDSFALRRLEQQVFAADQAQGFAAATAALVSFPVDAPDEIHAQAQVLARTPAILRHLPNDTLLALGARLGRAEEIDALELVLIILAKRKVQDTRLGVMARRLARAFRERKDAERAKRYTMLADRYV